eukprot:15043525-Alexandrium_andersonii.AAC.1
MAAKDRCAEFPPGCPGRRASGHPPNSRTAGFAAATSCVPWPQLGPLALAAAGCAATWTLEWVELQGIGHVE